MLFFLLLTAAVAYYQPGDPPQCFDEYQCVFFRFPVEIGLKSAYTWDLRSLCAGAGGEYIAGKDPNCIVDPTTQICPPGCYNDCKPDKSPKIRFNICGTVAGPLAPVKEENCPGGDPSNCPSGVGSMQELPIPASHGVAVQYIEGYPPVNPPPPGYGPAIVPGQAYGCADVDTCDQQYNPTCVPGSANYPAGVNFNDAFYTDRAQRCAINGQDYCSPYNYWCFSVKSTPCTKQGEIVAIYDGSPPAFNLINEGSPDGIVLSYVGAPPYATDTFPCLDPNNPYYDPSTGNPPQRAFSVRLACDRNVKKGISNLYFAESSPCQYIAYGSSALACGSNTTATQNQTCVPAAPAPAPASAPCNS